MVVVWMLPLLLLMVVWMLVVVVVWYGYQACC
jgi:hypothetical protein